MANARAQARFRTARRKGGIVDTARVDATTDEDIARQIAEDPGTAPELTDEMLAAAVWAQPAKRVPIALRVDPDVLEFFRAAGPGYQSRMNSVLSTYVRHARRSGNIQAYRSCRTHGY